MAEISSKDKIWQLIGPRQLQHSAQGRCHALQRCRDVIGHPWRCVEPGKQPGWQYRPGKWKFGAAAPSPCLLCLSRGLQGKMYILYKLSKVHMMYLIATLQWKSKEESLLSSVTPCDIVWQMCDMQSHKNAKMVDMPWGMGIYGNYIFYISSFRV